MNAPCISTKGSALARSEEGGVAKSGNKVNPDPFAPARSREEWEAQGWASESGPVGVAPRLEATISIRFDPDGALQLRRAARLKGMTKSEFVRQATLQAAQKAIADNPLPATMWLAPQQGEPAVTVGQEAVELHAASITKTQRVVDFADLVSP
jgi:hypothetical protein